MGNKENGGNFKRFKDAAKVVAVGGGLAVAGCNGGPVGISGSVSVDGTPHAISGNVAIDSQALATIDAVAQTHRADRDKIGVLADTCEYGPIVGSAGSYNRDASPDWGNKVVPDPENPGALIFAEDLEAREGGLKNWKRGWKLVARGEDGQPVNVLQCAWKEGEERNERISCHTNPDGYDDKCKISDEPTKASTSATATSTKTLTPTSGATATLTPTTGSTDVAPSATSTRTLTPKPGTTEPTPVATKTRTLTPTTGSTDVAPSATPTPTRTPTPVASPTGITCTPIPDINTVQIFADGRSLTTDPKDFGGFAANVPVTRLDGWEHAWLADGPTDNQEGVEFGPNRLIQVLTIHGSDSPDYEGFDVAPAYPVASVACTDSPLDIDAGIMSVTGLTPEQFLKRQSVVGTGCFRVEPDASGGPTNVNFRSMGPTWQQAINGVAAINSTFSGHGWKHFLNKQIWGTPSEPQLGVNRGPGMIEEFTFNRGDQLDATPRTWRICPDGKFAENNMSTNFDADVRRITGSSPEALLEKLSVVGPVCMIAHN